MASTTEEHTVPKSRTETQVRTGTPCANEQERFRAFPRIWARAPLKSWPYGASALGSYWAGNSSRGKRAAPTIQIVHGPVSVRGDVCQSCGC